MVETRYLIVQVEMIIKCLATVMCLVNRNGWNDYFWQHCCAMRIDYWEQDCLFRPGPPPWQPSLARPQLYSQSQSFSQQCQ